MSGEGGATGPVSERTMPIFLDVEWTDQDGRHQGALTNELKEFDGKPMSLATGGRKFTAPNLWGIRVFIVGTKTEDADALVEKAQDDGYAIGW
jgi:hypothetical protein